MLITLYKIGGLLFRLLATNGFRVKAKKERFTAARSRCRQNLKYENFSSSFGRLRQNTAPRCVLHVHHDYFFSFNQSNHWFVALSLTLPSSDLKLPNLRRISSFFFCISMTGGVGGAKVLFGLMMNLTSPPTCTNNGSWQLPNSPRRTAQAFSRWSPLQL